MTARPTLVHWLWKVPVCVTMVVAGQMLGAALVSTLGLALPRVASGVDQVTQFLLFLAAALAIVVALAAIAVGLAGRWWERWAILAAFIHGVYAVGNAIEASIFTTLGGHLAVVVTQLPSSVLGALAVALLFAAPSNEQFGERAAAFFSRWRPGAIGVRLGVAVLAFPFFYFLFGSMIAPVVTPHYARLDFLVIPPMSTILKVIFTRSVLLLLVSLPVIVGWQRSRGRLILALGLAHFVAVGFAGLIQATFFPAILRWSHGVEILADSICYAAALGWLLFPRRERAGDEQPALQERLA